MGCHVSCDFCGEDVVGYFATLDFGGRYNDGIGRGVDRDQLYFHPGEGGDDGTSCLAQVQRVLGDIKEWTHREEGSGLIWRLVSLDSITQNDPEAGKPTREEFIKRTRAGTPLYRLGLGSSAQSALYGANLTTLEEVAGRSAQEVRAIHGVGVCTMSKLERALTEHALTFREEAVA